MHRHLPEECCVRRYNRMVTEQIDRSLRPFHCTVERLLSIRLTPITSWILNMLDLVDKIPRSKPLFFGEGIAVAHSIRDVDIRAAPIQIRARVEFRIGLS